MATSTPSSRRWARKWAKGDITAREREVWELLAEGHSNQAIADIMCIEVKPVENYIRNLYHYLELTENPAISNRVTAANMLRSPTSEMVTIVFVDSFPARIEIRRRGKDGG